MTRCLRGDRQHPGHAAVFAEITKRLHREHVEQPWFFGLASDPNAFWSKYVLLGYKRDDHREVRLGSCCKIEQQADRGPTTPGSGNPD
jgi:hypothetical protein